MPNLLLVAMCEFLNAMGSNITYVVPFTIGNCHKIDLIICYFILFLLFNAIFRSITAMSSDEIFVKPFKLNKKIWVLDNTYTKLVT